MLTCDLEPALGAVYSVINGKEVDIESLHKNLNTFLDLANKGVTGKQFLVGSALSIADVALAVDLIPLYTLAHGEAERKQREALFAWFNGILGQIKPTVGEVVFAEKAHASLSAKPAQEEKKEKKEKAPKDEKKGQKDEKKDKKAEKK